MFINKSYFIGEVDIPNTDYEDVIGLIDKLIKEHEPKFLQDILGYDLYKQFITGLAATTPEQKWIDLRDGKEFQALDGRLYKWEGFKNDTTLQSPIAEYVFFKWVKLTHSQSTNNGQVKTENENSSAFSPRYKMVSVWNSMVEKNWILYQFLQANQLVYTPFTSYGFCKKLRNLLTKINPYF